MDQEKTLEALKRYVKPHNKVSREVKEADLELVISEAEIMKNLCAIPHGPYKNAHAIAHSQIEDVDPLRFWVSIEGEVIINPVITRHTKTTVERIQGCLSMPALGMAKVPCWNKCEIDFQTILNEGGLSEVMHRKLSGKDSEVAQHEIRHFDGLYIFPEEFWNK